ncbi:glycosyltransferase family 87 protein [Nocardioides caldifontis]|uniref:glycosyltransferase family 87 protein n=1 Tax=Nocardioides caldifontis TaxID=2588938 RepID=UPI0011DF2741|nr:glycosyltransferase 87 family protein [Nocardioides caldifontis]
MEVVHPTVEDPVARAASEGIGGPSGRHSRGHRWWTPVRVVLAVACVAWLLAMVQKAPCAADGWNGENARYAQMCYSDVPYLYTGRGFAELQVPFADSDGRYEGLEYPVLIGWFAYGASWLTQQLVGEADLERRRAAPVDELSSFPGVEEERRLSFVVTAILLAPFVLLAAWFLAGAHRGRPWDALPFAAAPTLVVAGLVNWDVIAVACVAGAFWAWSRGSPLLAGVMVGLGTAAKLYPLFLLGAFLVVGLRRRSWRPLALAFGGALASWLAVNLPVMLYGWEGWRVFWSFNADRGPDLGSLWLVAAHAGHAASADTVNLVSWVVFLAVCAAVLVLGLTAPQVPRVAQLAFLVLVGFLLVNKVYSPQYVLWLLPVAVLARPRWRDLLIWQAGELFYFAMVWMYLGQYTASATTGGQDLAYSVAIVVRVAAELYLAAVVVRDVLRPWRDPVRLSAGDLTHDPMTPVGRR